MNPDDRQALLKILTKFDQLIEDADGVLAEPISDPEDHARAEKVVALLKQMRANVEGKLDRVTET
jgi:hypothetical protein